MTRHKLVLLLTWLTLGFGLISNRPVLLSRCMYEVLGPPLLDVSIDLLFGWWLLLASLLEAAIKTNITEIGLQNICTLVEFKKFCSV